MTLTACLSKFFSTLLFERFLLKFGVNHGLSWAGRLASELQGSSCFQPLMAAGDLNSVFMSHLVWPPLQ